jgi:hypothetical protein
MDDLYIVKKKGSRVLVTTPEGKEVEALVSDHTMIFTIENYNAVVDAIKKQAKAAAGPSWWEKGIPLSALSKGFLIMGALHPLVYDLGVVSAVMSSALIVSGVMMGIAHEFLQVLTKKDAKAPLKKS